MFPKAHSSLLFLPLSYPPGQDAQKPGSHEHQRADSTGTGSGEDPERSPDTNAIIALAFLFGSATALGASSVYRRFFKRIKNAEWITPDLLKRKRWITGVVTRCVSCTDPQKFKVDPHTDAGRAGLRFLHAQRGGFG
jgi:hypothetical protein